jgi:hypothetical protein
MCTLSPFPTLFFFFSPLVQSRRHIWTRTHAYRLRVNRPYSSPIKRMFKSFQTDKKQYWQLLIQVTFLPWLRFQARTTKLFTQGLGCRCLVRKEKLNLEHIRVLIPFGIYLFIIYLLGWKHQVINYNTETISNQEFGAALRPGVNSYEILCQTLAKELAFKELDSLTSPSHPSTQSRLCFALACGSGRNREKTLRVLNVLDFSDSESYFFIFKSVW